MEVLDCVVTPEWAAALAGVSTGHLEAALARPDLWQEAALLERLLYKNANQHRGAQHFQRLQEVRRLLGLLRAAALHRRAAALHAALDAAKQRGSLPSGSLLLAYGGDRRRVPSHGGAAATLRALLAACRLVQELGPAVHRAAAQLLAQLAHSFFMPLCLTALAALARIQVLAGQLLLDSVRAYNTLAEAAALLPPGPVPAGTDATAAAATAEEGEELPQLLRAEWRAGLPQLQCVPCAPGESLAAQAAAAAARYALQLVKPEPAAPATVLAEGSVPVPAPRHQPRPRHSQQRRPQTQQAPVLAVVEDRGVPISREAFAAAAAPAPAAPAPAAAAAGTDDEDGEAVASEPGAGAAGAAAEGAAAAAAAEAAAPLPLLAVVEDDVVGRPLGRSGLVEVESLMEGESRGHLYRRTAAVLGQQPGGSMRSRSAPAAAAPAAQAAGAAPAAAAAPAAVAAAPAGRAAPKPAFVAVGAQPAKPAFLSVAAPAPATSAAVAAPAAAAAQAAVVAAESAAPPAAAAPLALAAEGGRKRKKPSAGSATAAAAAAAAAEQAAAAPKSWEDWLEPLGGGSAAAAGAPPSSSGSQPGRGQQGKRRRR